MTGFWLVSYIALWILVIALGALLLLLYRHFGMMSLGTLEGVQRDGLSLGAEAPAISGITADGNDATWQPKSGSYQMLLFASPDCEPCSAIMPFAQQLANAKTNVKVASVVQGPKTEVVRMVDKHHPSFQTLADDGSGAFPRFQVRVTPFGFVIGPDGRILAKGLCSDPARMRMLLQSAGLQDAAAAIQTA
ncbi:MAG: TlpA family protein disulfide reductase [Chloroflexota bacterium]